MQIEIVAYAIILAWFLAHAWGFLIVLTTSDIEVLHKYETWFQFRRLARKKLREIYRTRINESTSEREVGELILKFSSLGHFQDLWLAARSKYDTLKFARVEKEISDALAANNEQALVELLHMCSTQYDSGNANLYDKVVKALRPFTERRIKEAQTLEDLIFLGGFKKYLNTFFAKGVSRLDISLEDLYVAKSKLLVLRDALSAQSERDRNSICFKAKTGNNVVDALLAVKKNILSLPQEVCSRNALLKEVDAALQEAAEHS